jgi:hypothetical protein
LHGALTNHGPGGNSDDKPVSTVLVPQVIHADPYGMQHGDFDAASVVRVHLVSPEEFERRSGLPRPGPLDPSETYQGRRLP